MTRGGLIAALALTGACADFRDRPEPPFNPRYGGIETQLLDGDLVRFLVYMTGARTPADVSAYAECAAAQYTLIRGYGFARHLRTNVDERDGIWTADAVYTISAALPDGLKKLDAEVVVANCAERNIPMV
ncbi:hypothetical protein [Pseudaestuariivita atlantica]|uniref:Lipoprotein n=1 Tax=Pseudaestuariivita atlantica TaxID=1317121 RepID=A0A0L1JL48_9RHOB|nr:hypothetical protein [Pseudaestuariivita atlantica]KNG92476.1 lipoprotein [Pseudaestuariivita atlantica]